MKRILPLLLVGLILVSLAPAPATHAARPLGGAGAALPSTVTVLVGLGQAGVSAGAQLAFTPKYVDITVGDTVIFKHIDRLEPHTVSFGPMALLKQLVQSNVIPTPQKNGPPLLIFNPKVALPTPGNTFDGTGFANSGLMRAGQSWSLTFTQPGTYRYICLVHGPIMMGVVIVHPQQQGQGHLWIVQAGDSQAAASDAHNTTVSDSFYPRHLTIHAGDTVEWTPGGFHTVSFGPEALIQQLEKTLIMAVPQPGGGPPQLQINPKVAFPSGGPTYNGTGFVNSGILVLPKPHPFKLTFTTPGTYTYDCLVHPDMDGTITVAP